MAFIVKQRVKWREVKTDEVVRLANGDEFVVTSAWDSERVFLAKRSPLGKVGMPTPVPLVDGDKEVDVFRKGNPLDEGINAFVDKIKTAVGSPPLEAARIVPDGHMLEALEAGERLAERPKFGQPSGTVMADAAVIVEAELGAELVSETIEEGGTVRHRVPRHLDRLALASHLYLMHGIYGADVEDREALSAVHARAHASETYVAEHEHVDRAEMLKDD